MKTDIKFELTLKVEVAECGTELLSYYNNDKYVGDIENVKFLVKYGIIPEAFDGHNVCFIGKSWKDGKWYGWSHRAFYGFGIGDTVKEGDCCAASGDPYALPVGFKAKTEEDCKKMAIAFASCVG